MTEQQLPVWRQPVLGGTLPPEAMALPGLEALQLFTAGRAPPPPLGYLTGLTITEISRGAVTFEMPMTGWLLGPQGRSYGGVLAILADGPLGCAVHTSLPAGHGYTTTELALSLVRPVPTSGKLTARARVIYSGQTTALADAEIVADDGRLIAHCTTRCSVFAIPVSAEEHGELPTVDVEFPEHSPFRHRSASCSGCARPPSPRAPRRSPCRRTAGSPSLSVSCRAG